MADNVKKSFAKISQTTSQNLVSKTYLHSNPLNFYAAANYITDPKLNDNGEFIGELRSIESQLKRALTYCRIREKAFYTDFMVTDNFEFSKKYLYNKTGEITSNSNLLTQKERAKILKKIRENQRIYAQILGVGSSNFAKLMNGNSESAKYITEMVSEAIDEAISQSSNQSFNFEEFVIQKIQNSLTQFYKKGTSSQKGGMTRHLQSGLFSQSDLKKIEKISQNRLKRRVSKALTNYVKTITTVEKNFQKQIYNDVSVVLQNKNKNIAMIADEISTTLIQKLKTNVQSRTKILEDGSSIVVSSPTATSGGFVKGIGDIGELLVEVKFEDIMNVFNQSLSDSIQSLTVEMRGSQSEERQRYSHDETGQIVQINSRGQGASDMLITLVKPNGEIHYYPMQIKNSLLPEDQNWGSITIGNSMELDTMLTSMLQEGYISEQTYDEINYLLVNIFFQRFGEGVNNNFRISKSYEGDVVSKMNNLIRAGIGWILELQSLRGMVDANFKVQSNVQTLKHDNSFFVYKSDLLIPISWFFQRALEYIYVLKGQPVNNPVSKYISLSNVSITKGQEGVFPNGPAFKGQKRAILANIISQENSKEELEYKYPENLLKFGGDEGRRVARSLKINRIFLQVHINEIYNKL